MKNFLPFIYIFFSVTFLNAQTLPATYKQTSIVSNLVYPADFDWTPDGRYLVTQKGGNVFPATNALIKIYSSAGVLIGTFYDLTDSVDADFERGLLGIAVDPDFTTNHYIYAYYDYRNPAQTKLAIRVVRFTEAGNVGTNPTLILNIQYATSVGTYAGNHFGGIIRFRSSDPKKIYIQLGDLAYNQTNATLNYANKLNKPYGKILRINSDGTIPTSNPYYDDGNPATGNDDRIWTYGHRNSFGMCFNPVTDSMYSSENGLDTWDEFNIIHKGANYGWATCEGNYLNSSTTTLCNNPAFVNPIATWGAPLPGVTGCLFYSGTVMPEFNNHILAADNDYGIIYDFKMGNAPAYDIVTSKVNFADITTSGGLTTMRQGQTDGCIYAMKGGYTTAGAIYKICHASSVGVTVNDQQENIVGQNYPNPSNGETQIDYSVAQTSNVTIQLYDVTGRKIKTILNDKVQAGKHTAYMNGTSIFADGSYFYKMEVEQNNKIIYSETKRMLIVK